MKKTNQTRERAKDLLFQVFVTAVSPVAWIMDLKEAAKILKLRYFFVANKPRDNK